MAIIILTIMAGIRSNCKTEYLCNRVPLRFTFLNIIVEFSIREEINHFLNCIVEDRQHLVTGEQAMAALGVTLAADLL
jgi:hypothetical protein